MTDGTSPLSPEPNALVASQSGTREVYIVEARVSALVAENHRVINGVVLTDKWTRLHFPKSPIGVHPGPMLPPGAAEHGWLDYEAAEALAAWFRAGHEERHGWRPIGLETRLVCLEVKYSYEARRVKDGPAVCSHENRAQMFPREVKA